LPFSGQKTVFENVPVAKHQGALLEKDNT